MKRSSLNIHKISLVEIICLTFLAAACSQTGPYSWDTILMVEHQVFKAITFKITDPGALADSIKLSCHEKI
jgi:hypothetical protein